jgi:hypothetical protein
LNDPFEIPSLEEIQEMKRQRLQAIEPLQISEFGDSVKCQRCGMAIHIVGKLSRPQNDRVAILQKRIRWTENYSKVSNINDLEALKQELADLLEEDANADKLRSLPLYSCRITGWKFVCLKCYDKLYLHAITKQMSQWNQ